MKIETKQFGTVEVAEKEIITFNEGLFGFEDKQRYFVIRENEKSYFSFLQSADEPGLCFVIANAKEIIKNYVLSITENDYELMGIREKDELTDFVIITIPVNVEEISANLLGPIIINCRTMIGKQVISQNPEYTTKFRILEALQQLAS